jgi:hypothetical protein
VNATPQHDIVPYQARRPEERHSLLNDPQDDSGDRVGSPFPPPCSTFTPTRPDSPDSRDSPHSHCRPHSASSGSAIVPFVYRSDSPPLAGNPEDRDQFGASLPYRPSAPTPECPIHHVHSHTFNSGGLTNAQRFEEIGYEQPPFSAHAGTPQPSNLLRRLKGARDTRPRTLKKAGVTEQEGRTQNKVVAKIKSAFKPAHQYPRLKAILAPILDIKRGVPESTQEFERIEEVYDRFEGLSTAEYYHRRTSECTNLSAPKVQEITGTKPGPRRSTVGTLGVMEHPTIIISGPTEECDQPTVHAPEAQRPFVVGFIEPNYAAESHHAYGVDEEQEYAPDYQGPLADITEHEEDLEYLQPTVYSPEREGLQLASELESDGAYDDSVLVLPDTDADANASTESRRYTTTLSGLIQHADIHRFDDPPRIPVPRGVHFADPEVSNTRITSWVSSVSGVGECLELPSHSNDTDCLCVPEYDEPAGYDERPSRGVETVRGQRPPRSVSFAVSGERPHRRVGTEDAELAGSGERHASEERPGSEERPPRSVETVTTERALRRNDQMVHGERSPRGVRSGSVESAGSGERRARPAIGIGMNYGGGPDYVHRSVRPVEALPGVTQQRERRLVRRPAADVSTLPERSGMGMHVPVRMAQDSDLTPGTYRGVRFAPQTVDEASVLAFSRRPITAETTRAFNATRPVRRSRFAQESSHESSRSANSSASTVMPPAERTREPIGIGLNSSPRRTAGESAESSPPRRSRHSLEDFDELSMDHPSFRVDANGRQRRADFE